jgi:hypothetical protein
MQFIFYYRKYTQLYFILGIILFFSNCSLKRDNIYDINNHNSLGLTTTSLNLTTVSPSLVTAYSAKCGGRVTNSFGSSVSARGVCWSTMPGATINLTSKTMDGADTGLFYSNITGLSANTKYYVRAYATNSKGTTYGNELTFTTKNSIELVIGDNYGGGKIAYILQPSDPGFVSGETHGLIAALSDQSTGSSWGSYGTLIGGTSTALGNGAANTYLIQSICGTGSAARYCADLVLGGYDDWYLPSMDELLKIIENKSLLGGFKDGYSYWSSSEYDNNYSFVVGFYGGSSGFRKDYVHCVRAVRGF